MDCGNESCIQVNEKTNSRATHANRTYGKGRTYSVPCGGERSLKGKILADFIVERPKDDSLATPMEVEEELSDPCTLFTDGSSCIDGSEVGLILTNPEGTGFTYALRFRFDATNNEAKYEALIADLKIAEQIGVKNLQTHVDSRLVANQINGSYIAKEPSMIQYLENVKTLTSSLKKFSIKQVLRSENKKADTLRKITSTSFVHQTKLVLVEELKEKSINEAEVLTIVEEEGNTWMTPIYEYLTKKHSPSVKDYIATQTCELSKEEFNDFLTLYPIPSEYRVILPKSNQTIFDAPPGYVGLYTHSFSLANLRLPLTEFFCEVLEYFQVHICGLTLLVVPSSPLLLSCARLMVVSPLSTSSEDVDFRNFIYTKDDEDLSFLPKEPSSGFGTSSPSVSVNTEPLKADEDLVIQPTEVTKDSRESLKPKVFVVHPGSVVAQIKDRKCKTRGVSSRPPIKRKLVHGSSTSHATHAKTSSLKDDVPFLTVSDDDEGLPDVFEFKDATTCHLKIFAITPLAYKNHLDNHIDVELLDLYDRCYARQAVVNNAINRRSQKLLQVIEKLRGEFDVMKDIERARDEECEELRAKCEAAMTEFEKSPSVVALREKISTLSTKVKEHKVSLDIMMLESQKWASYQHSLSTLESKVTSLEAKKARLEAVEVSLRKEVEELKHDRRNVASKVVPCVVMELVYSDHMGSLVGKLVSSVILYGRCRAYEQVVDMKEPFDLSKVKGYHSSYKKYHIQASNDLAIATFPWLDEFVADPLASIEALLSKKPPSLQRPAPSRTKVPLPSSQRATPSLVPVSNLMSTPVDVSVVKPNPLNFNEGHHVGVNSVLRVACTL
ncbi:UBN2 domain-containing protein [Tanacetum coccineum]